MGNPKRIQLSRKKGWRKPENTVVVSRPSKWGNPYQITEDRDASDVCIAFHAHIHLMDSETREAYLAPLRGKNLACWCKLGEPCHADVLLKWANDEAVKNG